MVGGSVSLHALDTGSSMQYRFSRKKDISHFILLTKKRALQSIFWIQLPIYSCHLCFHDSCILSEQTHLMCAVTKPSFSESVYLICVLLWYWELRKIYIYYQDRLFPIFFSICMNQKQILEMYHNIMYKILLKGSDPDSL